MTLFFQATINKMPIDALDETVLFPNSEGTFAVDSHSNVAVVAKTTQRSVSFHQVITWPSLSYHNLT